MTKDDYLTKLKKFTIDQLEDRYAIEDEDDPEELERWHNSIGEDLDVIENAKSVGEIILILSNHGFAAPDCMSHLLQAAEIEHDLSLAPMRYDT